MKNKNKKRNPVAKELYTPKYKPKVIPNKKKNKNYWITSGYEGEEILVPITDDKNLLDKNVDDNLFGQSDEQVVSEINKKGSIKNES